MADHGFQTLTVTGHSTRSTPAPVHVVYAVEVKQGSNTYTVYRRYREFTRLHELLSAIQTDEPVTLPAFPPKTAFQVQAAQPYAFLDDSFITQRRLALQTYLDGALGAFRHSTILRSFFSELEPENPKLPNVSLLQSGLGNVAAGKGIIESYYADWGALQVSNINWAKLTHITFAFLTPNADGSLTWDGDSSKTLLKNLVTAGHNSNRKVIASIGGWSGSAKYSDAVNSANRSNFVTNVKNLVNDYNLDGVDLDWEYPNNVGAGNDYSSADASNFQKFLSSLRSAIGSSKFISIAVPTGSLWDGSTDVSGIADLDVYCMIMNYDVNGSGAHPGPNAPYSDACNNSSQPTANAVGGIKAWHQGGFPLAQILLGLPAYGYVSHSSATSLTEIVLPPMGMKAALAESAMRGSHQKILPSPDEADDAVTVDTSTTGDLSSLYGHQVNFRRFRLLGALTYDSSSGEYNQGNNNIKHWDDCSDTPFLSSAKFTQVVTYDDPDSTKDKAKYAYQKGCAGVAFWELNGDDRGEGWPLITASRVAFGYSD